MTTTVQPTMYRARPFRGFILVREPVNDGDETYTSALLRVTQAVGAENIRFRITFASTILVEERRVDGAWQPYQPIHGRGVLKQPLDLGTIALPCALLAPATGALPWLAAKPLPSCEQALYDGEAAMVDQLLRTLFDHYAPLFVLRSSFTKDVQLSTRLRANGVFVTVPDQPVGKKTLETVNQSGIDAYAGPASLRVCYAATSGQLLLMKPTTAHASRCWLNLLEPPYAQDVTVNLCLPPVRTIGPVIFDQDAPLFFVPMSDRELRAQEEAGDPQGKGKTKAPSDDEIAFALVTPKDVVNLASLVAEGEREQGILLDVIDQADGGLDTKEHEAFVTRLGKTIERLTRGDRTGRTNAIADLRAQLLVEADGEEMDERRIMTEMAARLRAYGQVQKDQRRRREKALERVRKRLAQSICSTGLTTFQGNLKVALRTKKIQENLDKAAEISAEELGLLLEDSCEEYGVLFVQLNAQHFVPALRARSMLGPLIEALDRMLAPPEQAALPFPFDALTAGTIIEHTSAQPHPLQQAVAPQGPTMLTPSPTGHGGHSFFAVPLLDCVIQAQDLGTAFNWLDETNRPHVAIPRILQVDALCKSRVAREASVEVLPTEDHVRRLVAVLCLRTADLLSARLSTLDDGFRGTADAHFDDTARAMLRGLVGWAVLTLTAGSNPQSMVFQILCSTIGRPERPRSVDDWSIYASLVRLLPATGWETRTTQTACARILARCLNSAVQRFTQANDAITVDDKKRYFAQLCYVDWVCGGVPHTAKRCKMFRMMHGKYDRSMPPSSVAAAFIDAHPEYTVALEGVKTWEMFKERVQQQAERLRMQKETQKVAAGGGLDASAAAEDDDSAVAQSDNAAVQEALLAASVTEGKLRAMCESSNNLVRLEDATTVEALASVATLCRAGHVDHMMTLARCAGFGKTDDDIRRTFRHLTEFFYARRKCQQMAETEEQALLAVLDWMQQSSE